MCNIAGYVGNKNSTPILLEMIKKQEGLNGGFFTGIAVHDGKNLNYRKVQGDLSILLSTTNAESLVGNTGIAHTRTPSGGDKSWAHPFTTERNGEVKICYVANGAIGSFSGTKEEKNKLADSMILDGYDIPCKLNLTADNYHKLSTGEAVHMSDVMCQRIFQYLEKGEKPYNAMAKSFYDLPSEIVGLLLEKNSKDCIYYSRNNKPMFVGFDDSGAYLASSPTAFPDSVKDYTLLPALSSGVIYKDSFKTYPYKEFHKEVAPFDNQTIETAKNIILSLLKNETIIVKNIFHALLEVLPKDLLTDRDAITYIALNELLKEKVILLTNGRIEINGLTAPKTYISLA